MVRDRPGRVELGADERDEWLHPARLLGIPLRIERLIGRQLAGLPKFANGEGSTVFWTTGWCLFTYGQNKDKAAEYVRALTYDQQIWQDSIAGTPTAHPGQLPPYSSLYAKWDAEKPSWMQPFVSLIRAQLDPARAITNHEFSLTQFQIGQPFWEKYLKGEEDDPKAALQAAKDAVAAEVKKAA